MGFNSLTRIEPRPPALGAWSLSPWTTGSPLYLCSKPAAVSAVCAVAESLPSSHSCCCRAFSCERPQTLPHTTLSPSQRTLRIDRGAFPTGSGDGSEVWWEVSGTAERREGFPVCHHPQMCFLWGCCALPVCHQPRPHPRIGLLTLTYVVGRPCPPALVPGVDTHDPSCVRVSSPL